MELSALTAISPLDGRYRRVTKPLAEYFSEAAFIKYRVRVEIEYFIALYELPLEQLLGLEKDKVEKTREIYKNFSLEDAEKVKGIEKVKSISCVILFSMFLCFNYRIFTIISRI